jgi:hypothetical protein
VGEAGSSADRSPTYRAYGDVGAIDLAAEYDRSAARPCPADGRSQRTWEKAALLAGMETGKTSVRVSRSKAKITRNRYEEASTVLGEARLEPEDVAAFVADLRAFRDRQSRY